MIKNKLRLTLKLFLILWFLLFLQVILKITFNYWQPYVIPTPQLEVISNFIDKNRFLEILLNGIFYVINSLIMILCSIKRWWFKSKKQTLIVISLIIFFYIFGLLFKNKIINSLILTIILPLLLDRKKWIYTLTTFLLSNIFLLLSLWLEGFTNSDEMPYIIGTFLNLDYYIMLVLNYMLFNLIKFNKKKGE